MYCFQLLLANIIGLFALPLGTGNESLVPLTSKAVALMFANANNYLMHILQGLWPGDYWKYWSSRNEQRNTRSLLLLQTWIKDDSVAQIAAIMANTFCE